MIINGFTFHWSERGVLQKGMVHRCLEVRYGFELCQVNDIQRDILCIAYKKVHKMNA
jgi:hypothetical protein